MSKPAHPIQEPLAPRKRSYIDPHHDLKSEIPRNERISLKNHERVVGVGIIPLALINIVYSR